MELGKTHVSQLSLNTNILFTCEHATDRIPAELGTLGLEPQDLRNCKDLYDPGALSLMKALAARFNASYLYSDLSRLVIDINRHFDAPSKRNNGYHTSLIKTEILTVRNGQEVQIPIPHNQHISEEEERALYDSVCIPYQNELLRLVNALKQHHKHVVMVSVHSFSPHYAGQTRTVDIDVMGYIPPEAAVVMRDAIISSHPNYNTAIDDPWNAAVVDGGVMFVLNDVTDITALALDIKNDNLADNQRVADMADAISAGIETLQFTTAPSSSKKVAAVVE